MVDKGTNKRIGEVAMEIIREVLPITTPTEILVVISRGGTILAVVGINSVSELMGMMYLHELALMRIFFSKLCKLLLRR
jgi:hypothetical protein